MNVKNKLFLSLSLILTITSCATTSTSISTSYSPLNQSIIKNLKQTINGFVSAKFLDECTLKTSNILNSGYQEFIYEVDFRGVAADRISNNSFYDSISIYDASDADPKFILFSSFWLNQIHPKTNKLTAKYEGTSRKETTMASWTADGKNSFSKRQRIVEDLKKLSVKCSIS